MEEGSNLEDGSLIAPPLPGSALETLSTVQYGKSSAVMAAATTAFVNSGGNLATLPGSLFGGGDSSSIATGVQPSVVGDESMGSIARLWRYCEVSQKASHLILHNEIHRPFYLPLPRGPRKKTEAELQREAARLRFLAKRDTRSVQTSALEASISALQAPKRSPRPNEDVLLQFNADPELKEELLRRVVERQKKKKEIYLARKREREAAAAVAVPVTLEERIARVSRKREELILQEQGRSARLVEDIAAPRAMTTIELQAVNARRAIPMRQQTWMVIVTAINQFHQLAQIALRAREIRNKNSQRWDSCKVIQKAYRQYLERTDRSSMVRTPRQESNSAVLRRLLIERKADHLCASRIEAATLIIDFLRLTNQGWKSIIMQFMRKGKLIQRWSRRHNSANIHRLTLLQMYFDRLLPLLITHIRYIVNNSGHDLKNLSGLETAQIRTTARSIGLNISDSMDTPQFHAFLRRHSTQLQLVLKYFAPNARRRPYMNIPAITRRCFLDLLYVKREAFVRSMDKFNTRLDVEPIEFSHDQVLSFIKGGEDPLVEYLTSLADERQKKHEEFLARVAESKFDCNHRFRKRYTPEERYFPLLSSIKAEDWGLLIIKIAEQVEEHVRLTEPDSGKPTTGSSDGELESGSSDDEYEDTQNFPSPKFARPHPPGINNRRKSSVTPLTPRRLTTISASTPVQSSIIPTPPVPGSMRRSTTIKSPRAVKLPH